MATGDPRIFQEIEATAAYYGPSLYSGVGRDAVRGLLTYFHDIEFSADPLSNDFIPTTTAKTQDLKLFAVGVLPPTANVTGRLLDRSYTIAGGTEGGATAGGAILEGIKIQASGLVELAKSYIGTGQVKRQKWLDLLAGPNDANNTRMFMSPATSSCALVVRGLLRKAGLKHEVLENKYRISRAMGDIREISNTYNATVYQVAQAQKSKKWIGFGAGTIPKPGWVVQVGPNGGSGHVFTIISVKKVGNVLKIESVDGGQKDGGGKQTIKKRDRTWKTGGEEKGTPGKWWWDNNTNMIRMVQFMMDTSKLPFEEEEPEPAGADDWQGEGSDAANKDKKEKEKTAGTPLNQQALGKLYGAAQRLQIAETQAALEAMKRTPPLRLLVNPNSFNVKGTKIIQDGQWGRSGPIVEHWGEEQDSVSGSGVVGGYFAVDVNGAQGPGLTRNARHFSGGWRNVMALYMFYKNNGAIYLPDHITRGGNRQNLSLVGSIYIYYDNILYIGSFDTFNLNESADKPFSAEYSFEFKVRAAFLLDRPDAKYDVSYASQTYAPQGLPTTSEAYDKQLEEDVEALEGLAAEEPAEEEEDFQGPTDEEILAVLGGGR